MAITQGDGSIILSTKVDTSGINKGLSSMRSLVAKVGAALGVAFGVSQLVKFSRAASQMATQTEAAVQRLIDIYGEESKAVGNFIDANARALGMSKSAAASFASVYGNLFSVWADQRTNAELTNLYLNMTAIVASKTGRTVTDVQERVRSGLLGNTEAIEDLGIFVNVKTIEMTDAFKRMADGRSWEQLNAYEQQQVRTLAILEQATRKYGNEVAGSTTVIRARYNAAYEDMKNTWGQFVNAVLMPVLKVLTQIMDIITAGMRAIAGISGKTIESTEGISSSIGGAVNNQEALTEATEETAKAQKKLLAGFDEIQILSSNTAEQASTNSNAVSLSPIPTDTSNKVSSNTSNETGNTSSKFGEIAAVIQDTLADILEAASKALLAIGLIAIFSGNIPLGIGLIIASQVAKVGSDTMGSDNPLQTLKESLKEIEEQLIPALLGLGVLLLFLGNIPLGIGLILAGITYWGYKEVNSDEYDTASFEDKLNVIMEAVALGLVAIGVILIFTGVIPLGIGLIIAGKELLKATEAKLNEGGITTDIQRFFQDNAGLIVGVGLALVIIALIMFAFGVFSPLSLGLLVAGGAVLATSEEMKPGIIKETITKFFQDNAGLIVGVGLALIVLGIILLITGVGIPLAIGLIVAGGGALVTTVALNCNFIVDKIKEVWGKVKAFWNEYIAPIFTLEWWKNLANKAGNGLIGGFESAVNGVIGLFESLVNFVIGALNKLISGLDGLVNKAGGIIGLDIHIPQIPKVSIGRVSIPRLAKGAVIPPNQPFFAMLGDQKRGTNIEAPLDTIVEAMNIALGERGNGDTVKEEHYYLDKTELMSVLYKLVKGGERLSGESLVKGV